MARRPRNPATDPHPPTPERRETPNAGAAAQVATVFGGSGFIGRSLIKRLSAEGKTVRIAVRHPETVDTKRRQGQAGEVVAVRGNILSDDDVRSAVVGADTVVNLVGILYETGSQTFDALHARGARRVAQASREAGVRRLVHMSALGASPESTSAYARTKAAGEQAVRDVDPDATILRPSVVFGPEDDFFNRCAALARFSPALPLIGGGQTRFQPVYVEDVVSAIHRILGDDATKGQTYELGGSEVFTFKELMETLLRVKGRSRLLVPIPFVVAELQGFLWQLLPKPPLTRDQVESLKTDNVLSGRHPGLRELGIEPAPLHQILPTYV